MKARERGRRILNHMEAGRNILSEAPMENIVALYGAAQAYRYRGQGKP